MGSSFSDNRAPGSAFNSMVYAQFYYHGLHHISKTLV